MNTGGGSEPNAAGGSPGGGPGGSGTNLGSGISVQLRPGWTTADVIAASDIVDKVLGGKRPTEARETLEGMAIHMEQAKTKQSRPVDPDEAWKVGKKELLRQLKITFTTHLGVPSPEQVVHQVFGEKYKREQPARFGTAISIVKNNKNRYKCEAIARLKIHVHETLEADPVWKGSDTADLVLLRKLFLSKFSWDTLRGLFHWAADVVDFEKSAPLARKWIIVVYVNLCALIKVHLDDHPAPGKPQIAKIRAGFTQAAIIEYWDLLQHSTEFEKLSDTDWHVRPTKNARKRSKKEQTEAALEKDYPYAAIDDNELAALLLPTDANADGATATSGAGAGGAGTGAGGGS